MENSRNHLFASLAMRIKASIIDSLIIFTLFILLPMLVESISTDLMTLRIILMFSPIIILEPLLLSTLGFTVGQYAMGIHVVREADYSKCSFARAFLRYIAKLFLGGFSIIYILFSHKNQAIHDSIANTLVVLSDRRIANNPEFAHRGEREGARDERYTYPSAIRRFLLFIVWYVLILIIIGFIYGIIAAILDLTHHDNSRISYAIEKTLDIILSILFIIFGVFASQGKLFGARRKIRIIKDQTNTE